MILATHEGDPNSLFFVALLVPAVVGLVLWLGLRRVRTRRFRGLVPALVVAVTGVTLHVSVITWRNHKDLAMCESWDRPEEQERCVLERRERSRGPWGIFVGPGSGGD